MDEHDNPISLNFDITLKTVLQSLQSRKPKTVNVFSIGSKPNDKFCDLRIYMPSKSEVRDDRPNRQTSSECCV